MCCNIQQGWQTLQAIRKRTILSELVELAALAVNRLSTEAEEVTVCYHVGKSDKYVGRAH